ncbi:MAG: hypothetical protein WA397_16125 [Roseiarcus sp.]
MAETQAHGAPFFFATDEPPTAVAIDDDIYLTVTTAVPEFPGGRGDRYRPVGRIRQGGHRPAFDRRHRVAPLQGALIGFTPLRPPSQS